MPQLSLAHPNRLRLCNRTSPLPIHTHLLQCLQLFPSPKTKGDITRGQNTHMYLTYNTMLSLHLGSEPCWSPWTRRQVSLMSCHPTAPAPGLSLASTTLLYQHCIASLSFPIIYCLSYVHAFRLLLSTNFVFSLFTCLLPTYAYFFLQVVCALSCASVQGHICREVKKTMQKGVRGLN